MKVATASNGDDKVSNGVYNKTDLCSSIIIAVVTHNISNGVVVNNGSDESGHMSNTVYVFH